VQRHKKNGILYPQPKEIICLRTIQNETGWQYMLSKEAEPAITVTRRRKRARRLAEER